MKIFSLFITVFLSISISFAQDETTTVTDTNTYHFTLANGNEIIGKILSEDPREIKILTTENKEIIVPAYEIKSRRVIKTEDFNYNGDYIGDDKFATRYFITTNGLPIIKGEHYVQWNIFGPDFQFGIADNFGIGVMTSWVGVPIILTAKYSVKLGEKAQFAVGALGGSGTWVLPDWGGILPFGTFSFGSRKSNIAFSGGYGGIWQNGNFAGRALASIAGMVKIGPKVSLVFDSFILLPGTSKTPTGYDYDPNTGNSTPTYKLKTLALIIPGIRWHQAEGKAFQFGFTGIYANDNIWPVPIPMVQWYRSF
jgi:hypothetical protein